MVRPNRIKEVRWGVMTPTSGTTASCSVYTSGPNDSEWSVNGEILQVEYKTNTTGSMFLCVSGTAELLWSDIAPSGTDYQQVYPMVYAVTNTNNATGSPQAFVNRIVHSSLYFGTSGCEGGSVVHFVLRYR